MMDDIIAAIATPPGEGGIAIIRISGKGCIETINTIFKPKVQDNELGKKKAFTMTLGWIKDEKDEILDEVIISVMRSPRSYTGEDVVEINCHGGTFPARRCMQAVLNTGIRLAEAGEFTRRAFMNGKIDAAQAEAVIDIIRAKTERGLKLAMKQLSGKNSEYINALEEYLIEANMLLEASIDFAEDVGELDYERSRYLLQETITGIDKMIKAGQRADVYREGLNIAICGKPNVGKSSLLNAMLKKEKAIVTNIPGTTRDIVEDYINIKGIPVKLIDTAGIRATNDMVEKIGVEKAQEVINSSDMVVFMLDKGTGMTDEDMVIYNSIEDKEKVIVIVNKDDLIEKNISEEELTFNFPDIQVIRTAVTEERGIATIEAIIEDMVVSGYLENDNMEYAVNLRQKEVLLKSKKYLEDAVNAMGIISIDCLGVDIQGAMQCLREITGRDLKEESIDRIFREFCIGK